MKISHLWKTKDIDEIIDTIQGYSQLNRIRPKITEISRRANRVLIALEILEASDTVAEAMGTVKRILKLLQDAKNSESLLAIRTNLERVRSLT